MRYQNLVPFLSAAAVAAPAAVDGGTFNTIPAGVYIEKHIAQAPQTFGATVTTLKYGPYRVRAGGMIENAKLPASVASPCTSCYITAMEADMEYANGQKANIDTGAWLHHMVLYNSLGVWGKKDIVCTGSQEAINAGVPTAALGYPHRIFASGNERAAVRINGKYNYGIPMDAGDGIFLLYDLVNESSKDQDYYIVMKYEHVPQYSPGYKRAEMVWMDITGCGNSDAPAKVGNYELKSPGWRSKVSGKLLATLGHTHDGGDHTTLYVNGKAVCTSQQFYNTRPGYKEPEGMAGMGSMAGMAGMAGMGSSSSSSSSSSSNPLSGLMNMLGMKNMKVKRHGGDGVSEFHISDVSTCVDFGRLNMGDNIMVGATYNTTKYGLQKDMERPSAWASIMGINPVYVGVD